MKRVHCHDKLVKKEYEEGMENCVNCKNDVVLVRTEKKNLVVLSVWISFMALLRCERTVSEGESWNIGH